MLALVTEIMVSDGRGGGAHSRAGVRGAEGTEAPEELLKGHPDRGSTIAHRPGEGGRPPSRGRWFALRGAADAETITLYVVHRARQQRLRKQRQFQSQKKI